MEPEEAREHAGRMLCEDCYMDALSPARSCDPWAVYTATRLKEQEPMLNPAQEAILACIDRLGAPTPAQVRDCTGLDEVSLQREFAALRHMELLRAAPRPGGGRVLLRFGAPDTE
jgi:hypothetical protein